MDSTLIRSLVQSSAQICSKNDYGVPKFNLLACEFILKNSNIEQLQKQLNGIAVRFLNLIKQEDSIWIALDKGS